MNTFGIPLKKPISAADSEVLQEKSINNQNKDRWIKHALVLETMTHDYFSLFSIWDAVNHEYIYISTKGKKLIGDDPGLSVGQNGVNFCFSKIHQDYKAGTILFIEKISALRQIAFNDQVKNNIKFSASFDYLFKQPDGNYFHMVQLCREAETTLSGEPMIILNYYFDVSHLKKINSQTLVVASSSLIHIYHFDFSSKELISVKPISKTEISILNFLACGKNSKEIANEIFISHHTVDTHRRHLLNKLNCIDTTAMINYAKMIGII